VACEIHPLNNPRVLKYLTGEFLVPQVFNARRFEIDTRRYPTIERITSNALRLAAFADAAPGRQPDAD
jgi:maleylpyruvate isomerase